MSDTQKNTSPNKIKQLREELTSIDQFRAWTVFCGHYVATEAVDRFLVLKKSLPDSYKCEGNHAETAFCLDPECWLH